MQRTSNRAFEGAQDDLEANPLASADEWGDDLVSEFQQTYDDIVTRAQRAAAAARAAFSGGGGGSRGVNPLAGAPENFPETPARSSGSRGEYVPPGAPPGFVPRRSCPRNPLAGLRGDADVSLGLARGGLVMPRMGGVRALLAEMGRPEVVLPICTIPSFAGEVVRQLPMGARGSSGSDSVTVNINVEGSVRSDRDLKQLAREGVAEGIRSGRFSGTNVRLGAR